MKPCFSAGEVIGSFGVLAVAALTSVGFFWGFEVTFWLLVAFLPLWLFNWILI